MYADSHVIDVLYVLTATRNHNQYQANQLQRRRDNTAVPAIAAYL